MSLYILPAAELHLFPHAQCSMSFFAFEERTWMHLNATPGFQAQLVQVPPGFATFSGTTITAGATPGRHYAHLEVSFPSPVPTDPAFVASIVLDIGIYVRAVALWTAVPELVIESDRNDRVITVYAMLESETGELRTVDVTAHPYLRYSVTQASGMQLSVTDGRISSGPAAGLASIEISIDPSLGVGAPTTQLSVAVFSRPTERPILVRVHAGMEIQKRGILFLCDGYTSAQEPLFAEDVKNICRRLLDMSPYSHIRESLDVFRAFTPSEEEGVSIGPPQIPHPRHPTTLGFSVPPEDDLFGHTISFSELLNRFPFPTSGYVKPLEEVRTEGNYTSISLPNELYHMWASLAAPRAYGRTRDTYWGTLLGERVQGPLVAKASVSDPAAFVQARTEVRSVVFDVRRLPPLSATLSIRAAVTRTISDFVATLRRPDGPVGEGERWAEGGDSFGLVVMLSRSDRVGGLLHEACVALSTGGAPCTYANPADTRIPGLLEIRPMPAVVRESNQDFKLLFRPIPIDILTKTVAHELGHSHAFGALNDEYSSLSPGAAGPGRTATSDDYEALEATNLRLQDAVGPKTGFLAKFLPWDLHRVVGLARIATPLVVVEGGNVRVTITSHGRLSLGAVAAGKRVLLRPARFGRIHEATVVSMMGESLIVAPDATVPADQLAQAFLVGDQVLLPALEADGSQKKLIMTAIREELARSGTFSKSDSNCVPTVPVLPPIPGFTPPAIALRTIAAHEGGGGFDCGVVHPTGECAMGRRRQGVLGEEPGFDEFCFVCKYAIVNAVDPEGLASLDREYPR